MLTFNFANKSSLPSIFSDSRLAFAYLSRSAPVSKKYFQNKRRVRMFWKIHTSLIYVVVAWIHCSKLFCFSHFQSAYIDMILVYCDHVFFYFRLWKAIHVVSKRFKALITTVMVKHMTTAVRFFWLSKIKCYYNSDINS